MRFEWTLQKVLDVTEARVKGVKAELFTNAAQIARCQQDQAHRRDRITQLVAGLRSMAVQERMERHRQLAPYLAAEEQRIAQLAWQEIELQQQREQIVQQLADLQGRAENLQRLRQEALDEFRRMEELREQQELDDLFQVSYTRKQQQQRMQASA